MKKQFVILLAMLCNLFGSCVHAKPLPETPIASMEYRVNNGDYQAHPRRSTPHRTQRQDV